MQYNNDLDKEIPFQLEFSREDNGEEQINQDYDDNHQSKGYSTNIYYDFQNYYFQILIKDDLEAKIILDKKTCIKSDSILAKNLQKQAINLILKIIYKNTKNIKIKSILEEKAKEIFENWFTLIVTTKKFKNSNKNLDKLELLNKNEKFKAFLTQKQAEQLEKGRYIFSLKFFNEQLKKIHCEIEIQNSTQLQDLKKQILAIKKYLKCCQQQVQQQEGFEVIEQQDFELIELIISAFEQFIFEILMQKYNTINKPLKGIKRVINFSNQDLLQLLEQSEEFKEEFDSFVEKLKNPDNDITQEKTLLKLKTDEQLKNFNKLLCERIQRIQQVNQKKDLLNKNLEHTDRYLDEFNLDIENNYFNLKRRNNNNKNTNLIKPDEQQTKLKKVNV